MIEHVNPADIEKRSFEIIGSLLGDRKLDPEQEPVIKRAPAWLFDVLANLPKNRKNGKQAILRFSKWTLTEEMVGDTLVGDHSFRQYIADSFRKEG